MHANSHQFENRRCKSCVLTCMGMHAWKMKGGTVLKYLRTVRIYLGGMLHKYFEILMSRESFWCNLRL